MKRCQVLSQVLSSLFSFYRYLYLAGKGIQTLSQGLASPKRLNPEPVLFTTIPYLTKSLKDEPSSAKDESGAR